MATIVLDPGHGGLKAVGGSDPNHASGPSGLLEKTATLDVAKRTEKALTAAGHKVVLTRSADVNLGLSARAGVAKSIKAPVFVSIHFNGFNHVTQGTETFCHTNHSGKSADLCRAVQKAAVAATGLKDRNPPNGVKVMGLGVLRSSSHFSGTACVLVEVSFMDVPAEDARLQTAAYKDRIAKGLAKGIGDYIGALAAAATEGVAAGDVQDGFEAMNAGAAAAAEETPAAPRRTRPARRPAAGTRARKPASTAGIDADELADAAPTQAGLEALERVAGVPPAFQRLIDGLGLQHVSARELLYLGGGNEAGTCAGLNGLPPEDLWPNIVKTARMLDEIRSRLGYPVTILSGYRSPEYNRCIGGETASLHMRFNALDFTAAQDGARTWWEVAKSVRLSSPDYKGGIGFYRAKNFVHIDTRGANRNWRGRGE